MTRKGTWASAWLAAGSGVWGVAVAEEPALKPHPRLWWPAWAEAQTKDQIAADPLAKELQRVALRRADKILGERTCRYEIPDGKRLLGESRRAIFNVLHTAWAWRTTGERKYFDRCVAELDAACALKDWNPKHFLDTAEMATAVAVGHDWLWPALSEEQRQRHARAIIDKALLPAKQVYAKGGWWARPGNNWSQVCGTGIALAAAAIEENDPALCRGLWNRGAALIDGCLKFYQPDGCYPEGPGYWHYGTNYHVLLLAAAPLLDREAEVPDLLRRTGDFIIQLSGPGGVPFNFADAGAGRGEVTAAQSWIASRFRDAGQAAHLRARLAAATAGGGDRTGDDRFFPLHLLWLPEQPKQGAPPLPVAAVFGGEQPVACMRTAWRPDATWIAVKGGTPAASHGHMDVGSFVFDAHGQRWVHDLGSDDYNMPGYFGGQRWDYFRLNSLSHNTLVIGGKLQNPKSPPCPVVRREREGTWSVVAFDLSKAYQGQARSVRRTVRFDHDSGVAVVVDEVEEPAGDVRWAVVTDAATELRQNDAVLRKRDRQLTLRRVDASGGSWQVADAAPPTARERSNKGFRVLSFTAPKAASLKLEVGFRP